jgi:hypothetical protein
MFPTDHPQPRRRFLQRTGGLALGAAAGSLGLPILVRPVAAFEPEKPTPPAPELLVKYLFDSLSPRQRETICFPWGHVDGERGLLRTRIENNWTITKPAIKSDFYTREQQDVCLQIFRGMTNPEWHDRFDRQLKDDVGGFGNSQSIAIFGHPDGDRPDGGPFEFVLASRHMTLRCDGRSNEHVAFGGPILYAHEGEDLYEEPTHPNNVFWPQAVAANELYGMFDGRQRKLALVTQGMPSEEEVGFRGTRKPLDGIPVTEMSRDQREHLQGVLKLLLEPFRQSDRDEVTRCLKVQGGLDACRLAFYREGDLGDDGVWDNWRLEGPSFVWYFRGKPHVHVWVHVADTPEVVLNAYQNSVGV